MPERAGGWTAELLVAGSIPLPDGSLAPPGELGAITVVSNVLLLRGHGRVVLVDTPAGELGAGWEGTRSDLTAALSAAGCAASDVDAVVLTHLDFDHCGGVSEIPTARVLASAEALAAVNEQAGSARVLAAAGSRVSAFDGEPFPEVRLVPAPGHRAGHCVVDVGAGSDRLVFLADVVHHPVHASHPEWDSTYDSDPPVALATRRDWLERLAGSGVRCAASHIDGWGIVDRDGGALRWRPA
jgi:glyoxylase-like metal-dependent hydrolase (beta-lactamase superfamily II)